MITVVIPTYNRGHIVGRAIRSVLEQTYNDFELIIVDDASQDSTSNVVNTFQKNDTRIKYIKHKTNKGGAAARNTGISAARREYLAFLDSDDEWLRDKLEREINMIVNRPGFVIYTFGHSFIHAKTRQVLRKCCKELFVNQKDVLRRTCLATNDFIAKCNVIKSLGGFDEKLSARQDWDMWIRITSVGLGLQLPLNTVCKYVYDNGQISSGISAKLEGTRILYEKHKSLFLNDKIAHSSILGSLGLMCLIRGDNVSAIQYIRCSLKHTGSILKKIRLLAVFGFIKVFGEIGTKLFVIAFRNIAPHAYVLR